MAESSHRPVQPQRKGIHNCCGLLLKILQNGPLQSTTTEAAINHLKSFFCRHGIPDVLVSDNGPQFAAATFSKVAEEWGFKHLTSSPHYPRGKRSQNSKKPTDQIRRSVLGTLILPINTTTQWVLSCRAADGQKVALHSSVSPRKIDPQVARN